MLDTGDFDRLTDADATTADDLIGA